MFIYAQLIVGETRRRLRVYRRIKQVPESSEVFIVPGTNRRFTSADQDHGDRLTLDRLIKREAAYQRLILKTCCEHVEPGVKPLTQRGCHLHLLRQT